jgi:feruloyl esterase
MLAQALGESIMFKRCLALVAIVMAPVAAQAAPGCGTLKALTIPQTTIETVEPVAAPFRMPVKTFQGDVVLQVEHAFCRVKGVIRPSPTSNIHFETWLPDDWNGDYFQAGNGGLAGHIQYAPMADALARGYAASSTDDGTTGSDNLDWQADPQRELDYRIRAVHLTAVAGEALVRAHYGRPARHALFVGGSKGGQEAMQEVQDFPEDFDAVAAIYPGIGNRVATSLIWASQQVTRTPEAMLREPQLALLHKAVLAECGGRDGGLASDGFLTFPPSCRFDPQVLQCKGAPAADCLTADQAAAARAIYAGPSNPRTGETFGTGMLPGSEAPSISIAHGWGAFDGTTVRLFALENSIGKNQLGKAGWSYRDFDFDKDVAILGEASRKGLGDTFKADIRAFKARGGKLLMIQGWDDPIVPAASSIRYFEQVVADQAIAPDRPAGRGALDETRSFFRLFMVPGFGHGATSGLQPVDPLGALATWVQGRHPPAVLAAARYESGDLKKTAVLTRELCPWPDRPQISDGQVVCRPAPMTEQVGSLGDRELSSIRWIASPK